MPNKSFFVSHRANIKTLQMISEVGLESVQNYTTNAKPRTRRQSKSVPWPIVSNSTDWSSRTSAVASPVAGASWTSFLMDSGAVSVK